MSPAAPNSADSEVSGQKWSAAEVLRGTSRTNPLGLVQFSDSIPKKMHILEAGVAEPVWTSVLAPQAAFLRAGDRGLLGYLNYELGHELEDAIGTATRGDWPLSAWVRLKQLQSIHEKPNSAEFHLGPFRSTMGKSQYCAAARRAIEYIRAGDVYQVNLAHRMSAPFVGSTRELAARLFEICDPRYGSYLEMEEGDGTQRVIISLSPELFLRFDPANRSVTTQPMKGTRTIAAGKRDLETSSKDRAELAMIVDLMRNDLGRVCDVGTVRVDTAREIESHGSGTDGVLQATATISGRLRDGLSVSDLLCATFPGGSITGAPKIRAMQIIDELEGFSRGPYCGSIGFIDASGAATFNIAIRTLCITGKGPSPGMFDSATAEYCIGAGIVADSDPESEWRETLDKAWMLRKVSTIEDQP